MKNGLSSLLVFLQRIQSDGTVDSWVNNVKYGLGVVGNAFTNLKNIGAQTWHYITYLGADFYAKNKPIFDRMKIIFGNLFAGLKTNAGPILGQITNVLIPSLINILFTVGQKVLDVAGYFIDNWSWIGPLVQGITIALGGYLLYLGYVKVATGIATAAQWLWNVAMGANPIGLVILGIGLLIGAGILLYQNFDKVKQVAWDMWIGVKNSFIDGANACIDMVNLLISAINMIPGVEIAPLAKVQRDTSVAMRVNAEHRARRNNGDVEGTFAKGLDYVPFDGFRAELHKGERILTAAETRSMDAAQSKSGSTGRSTGTGGGVTIQNLVGQLTISGASGDAAGMVNEFINLLYAKFKAADSILSTADMGVLLHG